MAITPWEPTSNLFRTFLEDVMTPTARAGVRVPDTDVVETEGEIRVVCEVPGLRPDDIDVSLENNVLTISGEKRAEREEKAPEGTYHLSERRYGRFTRSFVLPREVEQDRIQASYENGLLTISIPKTEKARRRRIEVQGGSGEQRIQTSTGERGA